MSEGLGRKLSLIRNASQCHAQTDLRKQTERLRDLGSVGPGLEGLRVQR